MPSFSSLCKLAFLLMVTKVSGSPVDTCLGAGMAEPDSSGLLLCRDIVSSFEGLLTCEETKEVFLQCVLFTSANCDPKDEAQCNEIKKIYGSLLDNSECKNAHNICEYFPQKGEIETCNFHLQGFYKLASQQIFSEEFSSCEEIEKEYSAKVKNNDFCNPKKNEQCFMLSRTLNSVYDAFEIHADEICSSPPLQGKDECLSFMGLNVTSVEACLGDSTEGALFCKQKVEMMNEGETECGNISEAFARCLKEEDTCNPHIPEECQVMTNQLNEILESNSCPTFDATDSVSCSDRFRVPSDYEMCSKGMEDCSSPIITNILAGEISTCEQLKVELEFCLVSNPSCDPKEFLQCRHIQAHFLVLNSMLGAEAQCEIPVDGQTDQQFCNELYGLDPIAECLSPSDYLYGLSGGKEMMIDSVKSGDIEECESISQIFAWYTRFFSNCNARDDEQCNIMTEALNEVYDAANCPTVDADSIEDCEEFFDPGVSYDDREECYEVSSDCFNVIEFMMSNSIISSCSEIEESFLSCVERQGSCNINTLLGCHNVFDRIQALFQVSADSLGCVAENFSMNSCIEMLGLPPAENDRCAGSDSFQDDYSGMSQCLLASEIAQYSVYLNCEEIREFYVKCLRTDGSCDPRKEAECGIINLGMNHALFANPFCINFFDLDDDFCLRVIEQPENSNVISIVLAVVGIVLIVAFGSAFMLLIRKRTG